MANLSGLTWDRNWSAYALPVEVRDKVMARAEELFELELREKGHDRASATYVGKVIAAEVNYPGPWWQFVIVAQIAASVVVARLGGRDAILRREAGSPPSLPGKHGKVPRRPRPVRVLGKRPRAVTTQRVTTVAPWNPAGAPPDASV